MADSIGSSTIHQDQVEQVSWELMETFEAMATLSDSADRLAAAHGIEHAGEITLECALDITESTGGAVYIPRESEWVKVAAKKSGTAIDEQCQQWLNLEKPSPFYDDDPYSDLRDNEGHKVQACLYVPFHMGGAHHGLIFLFTTESRKYSSVDIKLVQTLSCQGALAVRCFTHLDQVKEKNVALREALDELEKAQDEMVRSERLSALGQMASMIVHDIKNPLGGLLGYAQLLEKLSESLTPAEIKQYAGVIIKEMRRLSDMTEEIMTFSRGMEKQLNLREVTPKDLVAVAAPVIDVELKSLGISFECENQDRTTLVMADTDKMERVFINLAVNARDALGKGGAFSITSHKIEEEECVEFSIKDSGQGIPDEWHDKVFEPFQTRKKGKSLGIGLAVAKWIVEGHGGQIWLQTTGLEGTEFRMRLPTNKTEELG